MALIRRHRHHLSSTTSYCCSNSCCSYLCAFADRFYSTNRLQRHRSTVYELIWWWAVRLLRLPEMQDVHCSSIASYSMMNSYAAIAMVVAAVVVAVIDFAVKMISMAVSRLNIQQQLADFVWSIHADRYFWHFPNALVWNHGVSLSVNWLRMGMHYSTWTENR